MQLFQALQRNGGKLVFRPCLSRRSAPIPPIAALGDVQIINDVQFPRKHRGSRLRFVGFALLPAAILGEMLRDQQCDMRIGALRGHGNIGQRSLFIDERQAFGALLRYKRGRLAEAGGHRAALVEKVGALFGIQRLGIDGGIIKQSPGEPMTQRRAAPFVAVSDMLLVKASSRASSVLGASSSGQVDGPERLP